MTEEEQQFNQWFDEYADGVKVFEEADMKQAYLQGRAELEKENAELKSGCGMCYRKDKEQLTKAKEIIKGLKAHLDLSDCVNNDYRLQLLKQAEQFLKDQEEEPCGQ